MTKVILGNIVSNEYKRSYTAVTTHQFLTYLLQILTALLDFKICHMTVSLYFYKIYQYPKLQCSLVTPFLSIYF